MQELLVKATLETIYMVAASTFFAVVGGLPLGILLVVTEPNHILENSVVHKILSVIINITRSIPFIILLVTIIPFTKLLVGTFIGTTAAIVPLSVAAMPFFARIVESSLKEVDYGVIEAALAMGSSPGQIIFKVLLPEARASLTLGITITIINLIGYSAMAGAIGGGGLGDVAIRYGYHRRDTVVLTATVIILVGLVQLIQFTGDLIARKLNKK
ncbi:MAG TPA: ABC transporter permease [Clostridia bacterium]|nr:ABC transporter permease [Clostridia bacterium]